MSYPSLYIISKEIFLQFATHTPTAPDKHLSMRFIMSNRSMFMGYRNGHSAYRTATLKRHLFSSIFQCCADPSQSFKYRIRISNVFACTLDAHDSFSSKLSFNRIEAESISVRIMLYQQNVIASDSRLTESVHLLLHLIIPRQPSSLPPFTATTHAGIT